MCSCFSAIFSCCSRPSPASSSPATHTSSSNSRSRNNQLPPKPASSLAPSHQQPRRIPAPASHKLSDRSHPATRKQSHGSLAVKGEKADPLAIKGGEKTDLLLTAAARKNSERSLREKPSLRDHDLAEHDDEDDDRNSPVASSRHGKTRRPRSQGLESLRDIDVDVEDDLPGGGDGEYDLDEPPRPSGLSIRDSYSDARATLLRDPSQRSRASETDSPARPRQTSVDSVSDSSGFPPRDDSQRPSHLTRLLVQNQGRSPRPDTASTAVSSSAQPSITLGSPTGVSSSPQPSSGLGISTNASAGSPLHHRTASGPGAAHGNSVYGAHPAYSNSVHGSQSHGDSVYGAQSHGNSIYATSAYGHASTHDSSSAPGHSSTHGTMSTPASHDTAFAFAPSTSSLAPTLTGPEPASTYGTTNSSYGLSGNDHLSSGFKSIPPKSGVNSVTSSTFVPFSASYQPHDEGRTRSSLAYLTSIDDMPSALDFAAASHLADFEEEYELEVPPEGQIPELDGTAIEKRHSSSPQDGQAEQRSEGQTEAAELSDTKPGQRLSRDAQTETIGEHTQAEIIGEDAQKHDPSLSPHLIPLPPSPSSPSFRAKPSSRPRHTTASQADPRNRPMSLPPNAHIHSPQIDAIEPFPTHLKLPAKRTTQNRPASDAMLLSSFKSPLSSSSPARKPEVSSEAGVIPEENPIQQSTLSSTPGAEGLDEPDKEGLEEGDYQGFDEGDKGLDEAENTSKTPRTPSPDHRRRRTTPLAHEASWFDPHSAPSTPYRQSMTASDQPDVPPLPLSAQEPLPTKQLSRFSTMARPATEVYATGRQTDDTSPSKHVDSTLGSPARTLGPVTRDFQPSEADLRDDASDASSADTAAHSTSTAPLRTSDGASVKGLESHHASPIQPLIKGEDPVPL